MQREVVKVKKEMKMMRMGPVPGIENEKKEFTDEEQRQHVRTGHALYDTRCELCADERLSQTSEEVRGGDCEFRLRDG